LVEVDNLTKKYDRVVAIDGVTFEAREGEIVAFLGKNGAGKTTTMRIMTGFMPATSGTVRINGSDIKDDSLEARAQIGYLPETAPVYDDMSVTSYLTFCARLRRVAPADVAERVDTVMKAVNINERRNWQIGKLSKGLRRRVGLAQSLVHNPKVLILDEPTEGLDPEQIIEIRNLIRGLRGDHTVILSTHILPEAQAMADRIVIINEGRIVAVDTTENLTATVQRVQRLRLEVEAPAAAVKERLAALPGVRNVETLPADHARFILESDRDVDLREKVAQTVVQAGWGLLELERLEPTLEDVFLQITARAREVAPEPAPSGRVKPAKAVRREAKPAEEAAEKPEAAAEAEEPDEEEQE